MRIRAKAVTKTTPAPVQARESSAVRVKATSSLPSVDEVLLWKPTVQMSENVPENAENVSADQPENVQGTAAETQVNIWGNTSQEPASTARANQAETITQSTQANEPQATAAEPIAQQGNEAQSPSVVQFTVEQPNVSNAEPIAAPNSTIVADQENKVQTPHVVQFTVEQPNVSNAEPIAAPNSTVVSDQENEAQAPRAVQSEAAQPNACNLEPAAVPNPVAVPEKAEPVRITTPVPAPPIPPEQPVQTACPGKPYTVRRGDSFQLIAKRFGVSVRGLLEANPELQPGRLMVGDVLCIPVDGAAQSRTPVPNARVQPQQTNDRHRVAEGESIADILMGGDVSLNAFQAANPRVRLGYQQVGEWLRMPARGARGMCAQGTPHVISGQTNVTEVAQHLGISIGALLRANAHLLPSDFNEGQVICIPKV